MIALPASWLCVVLVFTALGLGRAAAPDAGDLIGRFLAADEKPLVLRLRVAVRQPAGRDEITQVVVKRRRDAEAIHVLYQVLWPPAREGDALSFESAAAATPTGFVLRRGREPQPLADALREPYLDSDLDIEDLVTNYWRWPAHDWVGEDRIGGDDCWILASRPQRPMTTGCAAVRSWISQPKLVPLKTEFLDHEGRVLKTLVVRKTTQFEGAWTPVLTQVRRTGSATETTVEIVRADRNREIPLEEFSLPALRKAANAPPPR